MLIYLLDTNIIAESRKARPHSAVMAWFLTLKPETYALSAATIGELQAGIELTQRQDRRKADELNTWLSMVVSTYTILSADDRVFREWARIMQRKPKELSVDALLAATAIVHGLTVVTRNTRHFQDLHLQVLNPFLYKS